MSPIITAILALLSAAPSAFMQVQALWATVKSGASAKDQATVDAILAALSPKLDGDLTQLAHDAAQGV